MAQYYRVSPNFWKGRRSWSDREKLLAQYLLSCPHRNLEGLFWLPLAYVQADLEWPGKIVNACLKTLERDEFSVYDDEAQVIFVRKALSFQAPSTEKQVIGAVSSLERVPKTRLWDQFLEACRQWAPKLFEALRASRTPIASESHSNEIVLPSGSDPDIARTLSSNSYSSSNSLPPKPPKGGRRRDRDEYESQIRSFVAEHFPDHPERTAIGLTEHAMGGLVGASTVAEVVAYVNEKCPVGAQA